MESNRIVNSRKAPYAQWLVAIPFAFLLLFSLLPLGTMAMEFARPQDLWESLHDRALYNVWWFSTWQAGLSTVLTLTMGLPVTWAISRFRFFGSRLITGVVTVPFLMPAVVVATGVRSIMPSGGVGAILWAHVSFNVAVIVRIVGPRWALLDTALEQTAADLGARPLRVWRYVTWPHIRPAVQQAGAVVFLFCLTSFAAVSILGGVTRRTIESEIYIQAIRLGDTRSATSLAVIQACVVLLVLILSRRHERDQVIHQTISSVVMHHRRPPFIVLMAAIVPTVVVCTPLVAVVVRSFLINGAISLNAYRWLFDGTTDTVGVETLSTISTSVIFAVICVVITMALVIIFVFSSTRSLGVAQKSVATLSSIPLVVSSVTLGLGLIITFDEWPIEWRSERWLIPVIHSVIALPLALRVVMPAVQAIPQDLRDAAASLGANAARTWRRIDLPLLQPALRRASGLCAAISLGEFGATSFLSRSGSTTIPIAISQLINRPGDVLPHSAYALAAITIALCSIALSSR